MSGAAGDDALYREAVFAELYDAANGPRADLDACLALARGARSVLDLGCGTGALAAALAARGHAVTGVDPAAAMLAVARRRPGGETVRWVEAEARGLDLGAVFDLVLMTGHAFQVFLTDADRAAALAAVARHLAPGGLFVFDSRNPAAGEWRDWVPERSRWTFEHPVHGRVTGWNDVARDGASGVVTYDTFYALPGRPAPLHARARIAFPDRDAIARHIAAAGLAVRDRWGDWTGVPWRPDSPEIIPLGGRARSRGRPAVRRRSGCGRSGRVPVAPRPGLPPTGR